METLDVNENLHLSCLKHVDANNEKLLFAEMTMLDWEKYRKELSGWVGKLRDLTPATVDSFRAVGAAASKTGHLDAKTRQLISLAVAVTTRCDGCIASHSAEAVQAGATREEIAEALSVAIALNAGAALVYSARALEAVDSVA
jgi:AhpD family alkylhydroperoxidase